jgi:hypothetical protein
MRRESYCRSMSLVIAGSIIVNPATIWNPNLGSPSFLPPENRR